MARTRSRSPRTSDALEIMDNLFFRTARMKRLLEEERERVALGDLIRRLREAQGLTQAKLARKVGTSQSAIARIEGANYTGQKLSTIARIAAALGHRVEVNLVAAK